VERASHSTIGIQNLLVALPLLQVLLDPIGFAQQKGNVLIRGLDKLPHGAHLRFELLDKPLMFLIAPSRRKRRQLPLATLHLVHHFRAEMLQMLNEPS
jgi:hypothetical protein